MKLNEAVIKLCSSVMAEALLCGIFVSFRFCSAFRSLPSSPPPPPPPSPLLGQFCFYASCGLQQISHLHEGSSWGGAVGTSGAGGSLLEGSLRKRRRHNSFFLWQVFNTDWFFNVQQQAKQHESDRDRERSRESERESGIVWQLGNFICGLWRETWTEDSQIAWSSFDQSVFCRKNSSKNSAGSSTKLCMARTFMESAAL